MSCQQVPRLSEDPYTFTEPPVATKFFSSQKLPSIRPLNGIQLPLLKQQPNRTNGNSLFGNGVHKKQVPIYGKSQKLSQPMLFQVQPQQAKTVHHTQNQLKSPALLNQYRQPLQPHKVTKRLLPPPPRAPCLLTTLSSSPSTTATPPTNAVSSITTTAYTTNPPPLYQQQPRNFIIEHKSQAKQNHSNTTVAPSFVNINAVKPTSAVHYPPVSQLQQQHQQKPQATPRNNIENITHIDVESCITATPIKCEKFNSGDHCTESGSNTAAERKCNGNSSSSSSSTASSSKPFVRPKVDTKVFIAGKKSTGKSPAIARTKRSYSQSSHHEALQRIPSRTGHRSASFASDAAANLSHHFIRNQSEWHAPGSFIFDYAHPGCMSADQIELYASTQNVWYQHDSSTLPTREQKIEIKLNLLRRQAYQFAAAQSFRSTNMAKRRLLAAVNALRKIKNADSESKTTTQCCLPSCLNDALALTAYCLMHITHNNEQHLFNSCTAKFSDNTPCSVPVFHINRDLPLCREHAWKKDNYSRLLQEQKPKKPPRKKPKPSAMTRPPKRNKKKRKIPQLKHAPSVSSSSTDHLFSTDSNTRSDSMPMFTSAKCPQQTVKIEQQNIFHPRHEYLHHPTAMLIQRDSAQVISTSNDMFTTVCENSSAYESSEDTGVGGLSESELIVVPDEIPLTDARLLEEHDLDVLNQLPEGDFDFDLVQQHDHYEPTQEEQEDLERALNAVDAQVKSLEQMTGSSNFLGDFLDVDDEMMVATETCTDSLHANDVADIRGLVHT